MTGPTRISEMTWIDFDNRLHRDNATVLLPIGSLEQHGPHSPVGSDEILTRIIAEEVASRTKAMVAPSINYGVRSQPRTGGGNHFPGTISIRGSTLTNLLRDIICEFVQKGATRLLILDTHYENEFFVIEAIEDAMLELKAQHRTDFKIIRVRYFELLSQDVLNRLFPEGFLGWALEHAAVMTTSLHLFLTPKLADMSKAPTHPPIQYPPYDVFPFDPNDGTKTGCLSSPASASAEKGKLVFDSVVEGLSEIVRREFAQNPAAVAR